MKNAKIEMIHFGQFSNNVKLHKCHNWSLFKMSYCEIFFRVVATSAHELNALRMHIIDDRDTCYFKEIAYFDAY